MFLCTSCGSLCTSAWPLLPFSYLSPIALSYHSAHIPRHCLLWLCKKPRAFFPRHRDKERKSESTCLWQCKGAWAPQCSGDSVVIGTKQIKCQPFKRWLRPEGQAKLIPLKNNQLPSCSLPQQLSWGFTLITLTDILEKAPVVAPRSKVKLLAEKYNILHVRGLYWKGI